MADKIIMLACAAGMSTSVLLQRMQNLAKESGKDYTIYAKPVGTVDSELTSENKPDVILLGPQVGYMKKEIQKKTDAAGVPMDVIDMMDYGTMNATNILKHAETLME